MMGQELKHQDLGTLKAGASKIAVFNTSDLATGAYFYTISANGGRQTERVVVAH